MVPMSRTTLSNIWASRIPLTLFRVDPASYREIYRNYPSQGTLGYQPSIGFADAYPVHLINLASVRDVAAKVKRDIPNFSARRFGSLSSSPSLARMTRMIGSEFVLVLRSSTPLDRRCGVKLTNVEQGTSEIYSVEPD